MARLVFLGTPDAAVAPLRALVAAGHDVVLAVTRPDKRRGRGSALVPSPVSTAADELGIAVSHSLEAAAGTGAELGVVVAYGRIIPVDVLDRLPMVNLHFSLLPRWRGAAPVERAILEGDAETGVCLMAVEAGLDTGGIYAREALSIGDDETADELRDRLVAVGSRLLVAHLARGRAGLPPARDQVGTPSYAEKILPAERHLQWGEPAVQIRRVIRVGRAWTTFRGHRLGIVRATGTPGPTTGGPVGGTPAPADRLPAGTLDGTEVVAGDGQRVLLLTVQPEGRRPMDAADWRRGVRPEPGERLGVG